jgi:hypothetical protein
MPGSQGQTVAAPAGVSAFLEEYAEGWRSRDLQRVADLWDDEEPEVTYVADELAEILRDRDDVVDHLSRTEQRLGASKVDLDEITVQQLADDLVLTTFVCRWDFEWVSHSRVSALLRRRGDDWFFIHYMEAPFHKEEYEK